MIDAERVFAALGDPTRRRIVERLSGRPFSVSQLADHLGVTVTAVGQHLQVLGEAGLVRSEKVGRVRTCSLDRPGLAALQQWLEARRSIWDERFDRLGEVASED